MYFALAALAGALHVLAPDHWIPASLFTWQRNMGTRRSAALALAIFTLHCALGAGLYFVFRGALSELSSEALPLFTLGLILALAAVRAVRFSRLREVFYSGPNGIWGLLTVVSLLGPAESAVPVMLKGHAIGASYLQSIGVYWLGSVATGLALVFGGRYFWNRPMLLTRGIRIARAKVSAFPVACGVAIGLTLLLGLR